MEPGRGNFTSLQPVTISNGEYQHTKSGTKFYYCGLKPRVFVALILLFLVIVILAATIVLVAVAHADKSSVGDNDGKAEASTGGGSLSSVPASKRRRCPLKSERSCKAVGCLYSVVDEFGKPLTDTSVPKCHYPDTMKTVVGSSNFPGYSSDASTSAKGTDTIVLNLEKSKDDSVTFEIGQNTTSTSSSKRKTKRSEGSVYTVNYHSDFGFYIQRAASTEIPFDFKSKKDLNIMKFFLTLDIAVPEGTLATGLGKFGNYLKAFDGTVYTIWSRPEEPAAHPFVLLQSPSGTASGLYLESTYPMDIQLGRDSVIRIVLLDTSLKVHFLLGPTPGDVIQQYWKLVGPPTRPPYWGMGHFYGSKSADSLSKIKELVSNHSKIDTSFPVEGLLLSPHLNTDRQPLNFSTDVLSYLKLFIENNQLQFVQSVPPSIATASDNVNISLTKLESMGYIKDVFMKENAAPLKGMNNKKITVFPDYTAGKVQSWWDDITQFSRGYGFHFHENYPYSEIDGAIGVCGDLSGNINLAKDILSLDNLEKQTLCLSAEGKDGTQLEFHNTWAKSQVKASSTALKPYSVSKHPYIVSDASSPGTGIYAGHFHDTNLDSYDGLRYAINEVVTYNMLGIPFTGPNICASESHEYCLKWYYLSTISPLSWSFTDKTPQLFNSTTASKLLRVVSFRQTLLPYLYSIMYDAERAGRVPVRLLSFDYPEDTRARSYQDEVLLGDAMLYTPVLSQSREYRISYLPAGTWCNWVNGQCYAGPTEVRVSEVDGPQGFTFIKAGTAILTQKSAQTIKKSRQENVWLIIALDESGKANSTRFFDDGETSNSIETDYYSLANFLAVNNTLTVTFPKKGYIGGMMKSQYGKIFIYGLRRKVTQLTYNNRIISMNCIKAGEESSGVQFYKMIISETSISLALNKAFTLRWEYEAKTKRRSKIL